jgi:hypothetical protein
MCTSLTVLALLGLRKAFRAGVPVGMPYALVLFSFPLIYYVTSPEVYYRRPIDPMFLVLAVFAAVGGGIKTLPKKADLEFDQLRDEATEAPLA